MALQSTTISFSNSLHLHSHFSLSPPSIAFSSLLKPSKIRPIFTNFTVHASTTPPPSITTPTAASQSFRTKSPKDINVLITGSTGYIGKFVVRELCRRGFNVVSDARERSGIRGRYDKPQTTQQLAGSEVCVSNVAELDALDRPFDVVVLLARKAELEEEAARNAGFTYRIVRPTAFFKSLGGQVERVKNGQPYVMFGDGRLCACKPISEEDLASFIADCVLDDDKACKILPIGGRGKALTPLEQGLMKILV